MSGGSDAADVGRLLQEGRFGAADRERDSDRERDRERDERLRDSKPRIVIYTDFPTPDTEEGDVDDVAAAIIAIEALASKIVGEVTLVFCNNGGARYESFKASEDKPLFEVYKKIMLAANLEEFGLNIVTEEEFTPYEHQKILVHSPIAALTVNKLKTAGCTVFTQGTLPGDFNIKKTRAALAEPDQSENLVWFNNQVAKNGRSSAETAKNFPMSAMSSAVAETGTAQSLSRLFIGKIIGMSFGLSAYVSMNLDGFFFPKPEKIHAENVRGTYITILETVGGADGVDLVAQANAADHKGNSFIPWIVMLAQYNAVAGGDGDYMRALLDRALPGDVEDVIDELGGRDKSPNGKKMLKVAVKIGADIYGIDFIRGVFNSDTKGINNWITILVDLPAPKGNDQTHVSPQQAKKMHDIMAAASPPMWDMIATQQAIHENMDVREAVRHLIAGITFLDKLASPMDDQVE